MTPQTERRLTLLSTPRAVPDRRLLATCWTWSGDAAPGRGDETSPVDIRTRIGLVAEAGWSGLGLVHADLLRARDTIGFAELRRVIDGHGISLVELEFLTDWWTDGAARAVSDDWRSLLFSAAEHLGASTIKVSGDYAPEPVSRDRFLSSLDALATDAAGHGARIALEPMPMNNIGTLEEGMNLVSEVGNPAAGLCIDVWHVHRGGTPYSLIPSFLDVDKVFVVELDDSVEEVRGGSLWTDAVDHRVNPGDGEFDVAEFVATMVQLGWSGPWGVEMISEAQRRKPIDVAVADTFAATIRTLDQADGLLSARAQLAAS